MLKTWQLLPKQRGQLTFTQGHWPQNSEQSPILTKAKSADLNNTTNYAVINDKTEVWLVWLHWWQSGDQTSPTSQMYPHHMLGANKGSQVSLQNRTFKLGSKFESVEKVVQYSRWHHLVGHYSSIETLL